RAALRLAIREPHLVAQRAGAIARVLLAEERIAQTIDEPLHRREIDRDLVLETVLRRLARARGVAHGEDRLVAFRIASHAQDSLTIGVGHRLVKTTPRCYRRAESDHACLIRASARSAAGRCSSSERRARRTS